MTSFHVRHDFTPAVARDALLLLRTIPDLDSKALTEQARLRDFDLGRRDSSDKVIASLRDLGLVERFRVGRRDTLSLTPFGKQIADVVQRDMLLFVELMHLRYSLLWTPEHSRSMFAWSYQIVTGILWDGAPMPIETDRLVASVLSAAERQFNVQGISFSSSSILGILHWLRALSPPCIHGSEFRRRPACSPEALVLVLEAMQTAVGRPIHVPLRLNVETRTRACRSLLIDEEVFDDVLGIACDAFGVVRHWGDAGELVLLQGSIFPGLVS